MTRETTAIDRLADNHFAAALALSPMMMTQLGLPDRQDEYDDLSPSGADQLDALNRSTLATIATLEPADDVDAVTVAAMRERLGLAVESHAKHADLMDVAGIASGLHEIRDVYDLMPTDTPADWATIARRLQAVPHAIDQWFESQCAGIEAGIAPARRQVDLLVEQCHGWTKTDGFFDSLVADAGKSGLDAGTRDMVRAGVSVAKRAFDAAADRLASEIMPLATPQDGVGEARYELCSRDFLGLKVDFAEYYKWGLDEVARIDAEASGIAAKLRPGMTVAQTKKSLDTDEKYLLASPEEMRAWMQGKADEGIATLNGVHFDIPEPARRIECMIAGIHDGGVWYTQPSDDFSRPGRMWWSVPESQTTFSTWRELTTVYHEGVPGHHLQIGQAVYMSDSLNEWRRQGAWVSGHGEGWALYAEQLMAELGYHSDPATMLGMLDGQAWRAVRVVIDMGLHCGFTAPDEVGGGEWTFEKAWTFFNNHVEQDEGQARFEVLRYFGWPGQAPSYKIGERVWLDLRDAYKRRAGAAFSLKDFHAKALNLGSLPLSVLRDALSPVILP